MRDDGRVRATEVKLASTFSDHDTEHVHWVAERLGRRLFDAIVINTDRTPTDDMTA